MVHPCNKDLQMTSLTSMKREKVHQESTMKDPEEDKGTTMSLLETGMMTEEEEAEVTSMLIVVEIGMTTEEEVAAVTSMLIVVETGMTTEEEEVEVTSMPIVVETGMEECNTIVVVHLEEEEVTGNSILMPREEEEEVKENLILIGLASVRVSEETVEA